MNESTTSYEAFLDAKRLVIPPTGIDVPLEDLHPWLFEFQRRIVQWSLKRGRSAVFAGTGTGKTGIQCEVARHICKHTGGDVLIFAPLAVTHQTVREAQKIDLAVNLCRTQADVRPGVNIANYEMLDHFDARSFAGLVADESSILKSYDGTTRKALTDFASHIPFRLACTATPAPNDLIELVNHCLPYHSRIQTRDGNRDIGDIVRKREPVEVLSFDGERTCWASVTNWSKRPNPEGLWRIDWGRGGKGAHLASTPNHRVLTRSGWKPAGEVVAGDEVAIASKMFSAEQEEIIFGTLLGDSWLRTRVGWPALVSCHAEPQWDYLEWMADSLGAKTFATTTASVQQINGREINCKAQRRFRTPQLPALWSIWQLAYRDGKKHITRDWLDRIGPLGLACWAMDDGTMRVIRYSREDRACDCPRGQHRKVCSIRGPIVEAKGRHFVFCANGFAPEERELLVEWLSERFGLKATANTRGHIVLSRESTVRLREIVAAYIHLGDHCKEWLCPPVVQGASDSVIWLSVISSRPEPPCPKNASVYDIEVTPTHNFVMGSGLVAHNSEFLGVLTGKEVAAVFFTQDEGTTHKWRLKGHARNDFWRWLASWSVAIRRPSDIGYPDDKFILPPLNIHQVTVECDAAPPGRLFVVEAQTLDEVRGAMRASLPARVAACAELVNQSTEPWLIWCNLNDESSALARAIPNAVEVRGSDTTAHKEKSLLDFIEGRVRVIVSKSSICGYGLNLQHCAHVAFVGLSFSWEQYYQSIRRCWRFGQTRPVECYVITSEAEGRVVEAIRRKEEQAEEMLREIVSHMQGLQLEMSARSSDAYLPTQTMKVPRWLKTIRSEGEELVNGACAH